MKLVLIGLLILSLTATPPSPQFAPGQRAVVIRIDDIQDYAEQLSRAGPEYTVLQYQLNNRIPALLSIVAGSFGTNQQLVNETVMGVKTGVFEIGIHGWYHVPVINQSEMQQATDMKRAKDWLGSIFGIDVLAYVPPDGISNLATIEAMQATGLTLISASKGITGRPGKVTNGIVYFPETVIIASVNQTSETWIPVPIQSIITQISGSWVTCGVAVAVIHPRQFVDVAGKWSEDKWNSYVQMIDWITANHGNFTLPEPPKPQTQSNINVEEFNPFLIFPTLSGISAILLVARSLRAKRKRLLMQPQP